jgi:hypothetical protein
MARYSYPPSLSNLNDGKREGPGDWVFASATQTSRNDRPLDQRDARGGLTSQSVRDFADSADLVKLNGWEADPIEEGPCASGPGTS